MSFGSVNKMAQKNGRINEVLIKVNNDISLVDFRFCFFIFVRNENEKKLSLLLLLLSLSLKNVNYSWIVYAYSWPIPLELFDWLLLFFPELLLLFLLF